MKPFMFGLRDWWSQWAIDRAGEENGRYLPRELRSMVDVREIGAHAWVRHVWTRKYAMAGEVLYQNDLATKDEFDAWFPNDRFDPRSASQKVGAASGSR